MKKKNDFVTQSQLLKEKVDNFLYKNMGTKIEKIWILKITWYFYVIRKFIQIYATIIQISKFSQIAKPIISQPNDFKFSQISGIWMGFSQIGHPAHKQSINTRKPHNSCKTPTNIYKSPTNLHIYSNSSRNQNFLKEYWEILLITNE